GSEDSPGSYYYVYGYTPNGANEAEEVANAKLTANYTTYGVLYNWPAAMDGDLSSDSVPSGVQGICPSGWHLPSDEEWKILEGEVDGTYGYPDPEWNATGWRGTDAGGEMKETGTTHWNSPNWGNTNSSGFTALPGGCRYGNGAFYDMGIAAYIRSSTESGTDYAWHRIMKYNSDEVTRSYYTKYIGESVRCVKDCSPWPTQANAGSDSLSIQGTTTTLTANTPTEGNGSWTIISGNGGIIADATDPATSF
ncbi:MAG: hypothetical protein GY746_16385, partial [Gammaproteobacteria bacterium]|nr:hypothetical protein [Gammaproteobacteria bacterium]